MDNERIQAALRDAGETRRVVIGTATSSRADTLFAECFGRRSAVVVADETTFAVAGREVQVGLSAAGRVIEAPIIFPAMPAVYADFATVLALESRLRHLDAIPVAVGSGTLNDLTKLAAHRLGRPYMVVATAASMDGYTAFGAAITKDGFKQTMACPAPRAVLVDLDVLGTAPAPMTAAGYGDLVGKITAGADWLLADALGVEAIDRRAWPLVQDSLRGWTAQPDRLRRGDRDALGSLSEGLIVTGLAMQISRSSRPASGSEHQFSHLWEMQALSHGHPAVPHGFKVGIGSLASTALYEWLLARDLSNLDIDARCRHWPSPQTVEHTVRQAHEIPQLAENAVAESLAKYMPADDLRERLLKIQSLWPSLRSQLWRQLMPAEQLRHMLAAAGCPTDAADIGLSLDRVKQSYSLARTIRRRYTVLDLVYEIGMLDEYLAEQDTPGRYGSDSSAPRGQTD